MEKIIISQPRYLPAINYLQRLYNADLFVFLDTVQRQGRGWENRNKILADNDNEVWVTIPVESSSREIILATQLKGKEWIHEHKQIIDLHYKKHPYYDKTFVDKYFDGVEEILLNLQANYSPVIIKTLENACDIFSFKPKTALAQNYSDDSSFGVNKLVQIAKNTGCKTYVSGGNGKEYGILEAFKDTGINVDFHHFDYPEYKHFNSKICHPWLSFFDVLFNIGLEETEKIIKTKWELTHE